MIRMALKLLVPLLVLLFSASLWAGDAIWIDVRSAEEYSANHVSIATNIPHTEITDRIDELTGDKDALIYVYCRSGRRSGIAKTDLEEVGYTNVVNLGGFEEAQQTAVRLNICPEADSSDC